MQCQTRREAGTESHGSLRGASYRPQIESRVAIYHGGPAFCFWECIILRLMAFTQGGPPTSSPPFLLTITVTIVRQGEKMMIPSRLASVRRFNWVSILISSVLVTFLAACGGGGGGGGREDDPPPEDAVTITGVVDDGNSPIVGANCRFVDMDGAELDSDRSDSCLLYTSDAADDYLTV